MGYVPAGMQISSGATGVCAHASMGGRLKLRTGIAANNLRSSANLRLRFPRESVMAVRYVVFGSISGKTGLHHKRMAGRKSQVRELLTPPTQPGQNELRVIKFAASIMTSAQ
jgi:hypothetical protein